MHRRAAHSLLCLLIAFACVPVLVSAPAAQAPGIEQYFYDGKLAQGEKALLKRLEANPDDDECHFGLGLIHLLRAFEKLSASLYEHGLRTNLLSDERVGELKAWLKPHPRPKRLTHAKLYAFIQGFLDDLEKARTHLKKVRSEKFKLVLAPARIKVNLSGLGKPANALMVLNALHDRKQDADLAKKLVFAFDRADAAWLCGYCHFFSALGEAVQSFDGKELFESTAHLLFANVQTPYTFLIEEGEALKNVDAMSPLSNFGLSADFCALALGLLRMPIKEPQRLTKALGHLEGMAAQSRLMWQWILAETDDDREWIPSPKQTGALGVKVTKEMVDGWHEVLDEADALLKGKTLLPFWRGKAAGVGVSFRKPFTSPAKVFDVARWVQGTAATPYLEKGKITKLADRALLQRLDKAFGGFGFFSYAFWFN